MGTSETKLAQVYTFSLNVPVSPNEGEVPLELTSIAETLFNRGNFSEETIAVTEFVALFTVEIEDLHECMGYISIHSISARIPKGAIGPGGEILTEARGYSISPEICNAAELERSLEERFPWSEFCAEEAAARSEAAYDNWKDSQFDA